MSRSESNLGTEYHDGELIVRQGEDGDCMYVIQSGLVEVLQNSAGSRYRASAEGRQENAASPTA